MSTAAKTILLTGVSRGLGRSLVHEFAQRGHHVLGCARSGDTIEQLSREYGPPHDFSVVNVVSDEEVERWAKRLLGQFGAPDLLLNNAAIINSSNPLWRISASEFSDLIDTNIKGVANVIRHVVPAMVARRSGVIVNFSSGWGRSVDAQVAPYCASKWAIEGLTQALALELPEGMAAVPFNPGIIDTDMLRECFGDSAKSYPAPAEWARRAAPFLLGLGPAHNGRPLSLNGG